MPALMSSQEGIKIAVVMLYKVQQVKKALAQFQLLV